MKLIIIAIVWFGLCALFILKIIKPLFDKLQLKIHNWKEKA